MKRFILAAVLAAAIPAFAQSTVQGQTSQASGYSYAGIASGAFQLTTTSSPFTYGTMRYHTNQAAGVPTSVATPAVLGTCATAGWGIAGQAAGGGLSFAGPGGKDAGCDLDRDLLIMNRLGADQMEMLARACAKEEIATAMKRKCDVAMKQAAPQTATGYSSDDPYIAMRLAKQGKLP